MRYAFYLLNENLIRSLISGRVKHPKQSIEKLKIFLTSINTLMNLPVKKKPKILSSLTFHLLFFIIIGDKIQMYPSRVTTSFIPTYVVGRRLKSK